tara:strand:- start:1323 stop:1481 length:159 start_codon:yes stop_codon:yes gene_type:complete
MSRITKEERIQKMVDEVLEEYSKLKATDEEILHVMGILTKLAKQCLKQSKNV